MTIDLSLHTKSRPTDVIWAQLLTHSVKNRHPIVNEFDGLISRISDDFFMLLRCVHLVGVGTAWGRGGGAARGVKPGLVEDYPE